MIFYFSGTGNSRWVAKELSNLINDNIFSYDEKYKKIAFIFTGILILLHFFTNIGDIEDIQLYSFVYAFLRSMLSFLAVLEAVFIIEGIIKKKLKKK